MPGLTSGLEIGLTGLSATQAALNVIGNNIANVNTPGYSRETSTITENSGIPYAGVSYGSGVDLTGIQGIRDKLLNQQVIQSTSLQAGAQAMYQGLQSVSSVFSDSGTSGLETSLSSFFTSVQQVAAQPEDTSLRTAMVGSAQSLVSTLKTDYQTLATAQSAADQQVTALVPQVNTLTAQIASLNKTLGSDANASSDNTSQDQLQALATQLGQLIGIQTYSTGNQLNITMNGGSPLVVGTSAYTLTTQASAANSGYQDVYSALDGSAPTDVTSNITSGQLGAQLTLRDSTLPGYETSLNQFAAGLAYNMNSLQSNGYAYNATTPATTPTGIDFFVGSGGNTNHLPTQSTAANNYAGAVLSLSVNSAIVADPTLIAASGVAGASGDNTNATKMAALQTATNTVDTTGAGVAAGTGGPFNTFLTNLFTQVGNDNSNWNATATNQENITSALTTQQNSVSGVSLDTEATNLITFQRGYQASASFISTMSTLMNSLITALG